MGSETEGFQDDLAELGSAEVAAIFRTESGQMIVGVRVKQGKLQNGCKVRVWRRTSPDAAEEPVGLGELASLQSGKSPVKELAAGQEGGVQFKGKMKLLVGDRLDAYTEETKARKIESFR